MTFSWDGVAKRVQALLDADTDRRHLDEGQRASLAWIATRIARHGVVLADEVGTGKTRIACALVHAVVEAGGRAAVVVPHGLMHQWKAESLALGDERARPKELTSLTAFFDVEWPDATWGERSPDPTRPEWILVSHSFQAPRVRQDAREWRVALPELVKARLAPRSEREDRRTRSGKLLMQIEDKTSSGWHGMNRLATHVARRVRNDGSLRRRIENLPPLDLVGSDSVALKAAFTGDGDGRRVIEALLGHWIGELDLIVIDEAHKSRGHLDGDGQPIGRGSATVLARLLDGVLRRTAVNRRLCLTATPMELELEQWLDLLQRAGCGLDDVRGREVVTHLHEAARSAAVAPDEGKRLERLCDTARAFTRTLAPFVTRRRRTDDPAIQDFAARVPASAGRPHPHRQLSQIRIGWEANGFDTHWFDVLFAAECMSQAARGLSLRDTEGWPRAVRDAYTKLSQGHVSVDLFEADVRLPVPEPGAVDEHTRGKVERTAYWYRRLDASRRRVVEHARGQLDPDAEHPRILAGVSEIERWTCQGEKVLVFGVFLRPLELLVDVLNVRNALRAADVGRPIAHAVHSDRDLQEITSRQLDRLRREGGLTQRLAAGGVAEMRRALANSHKAYGLLRPRVRDAARAPLESWRKDPRVLGRLSLPRELAGALEDHLVSFMLDDLLAIDGDHESASREHLDELAREFLDEQLRPLLGDEDEDEDASVAALQAAMLDDLAGRQSRHARLLQGSTGWETRQYLQAAFNRRQSSPAVLVAQSQVGREGLNLHKACRVVLQFHAEWNPAILEQQIGRVDRKGSLWETRAQEWADRGAVGPPPMVEIRQLVFEGTYDAYKWDRVRRRQHVFDASLFGSMLSAEDWERVPPERRRDLIAAAPSFRPPGTDSRVLSVSPGLGSVADLVVGNGPAFSGDEGA